MSRGEAAALLLACVTLIYLAVAPVGRYWSRRREQQHLAALTDDTQPVATEIKLGPLARKLRAAGVPGPQEAYMLVVSIFAIGISLLVLKLVPAVPAMALVGFAFGLYTPWALLDELTRRRAHRFEQQLIDAVERMAASLGAAGTFQEALASSAAGADQPLRREFQDTLQRIGMGMPTDRALVAMTEHFDSEGVRIFAQALAAKAQAGGEMSVLLKALSHTMRDRWNQQRQVRAQLSGARLTALAVAAMPYLLIPALAWLQPGWFESLLAYQFGPLMLLVAVMLQMVGALWLVQLFGRQF